MSSGTEILLESLDSLRKKCAEYQNEFIRILQTDENDIKAGFFGMTYTNIVWVLELIDHYDQIWSKPHIFGISVPTEPQELERVKNENARRCIDVTKALFVLVMSSIEYCIKETIKQYLYSQLYKATYQKNKKRIYLRDIINESHSLGLLTDCKKRNWEILIEIRNMIVHNNAIANKDAQYEIEGIHIDFKKGHMLRGNITFLVELIKIAIDEYRYWLNKVISHYHQPIP